MRIGSNGQDPREISTDRATNSSASSMAVNEQTKTERLPNDTVSLKSLTSQALQMPDIRQDKVESLREMISNDEYRVDASKVADAMIKE